MSGLEYRFPPLTPEERERGRQRVLRSYRPNVARYFRNAESLRQDVVEEMERTGATAESLAEKSGESPETRHMGGLVRYDTAYALAGFEYLTFRKN